jgi:hypothetical protein
MKSLTLLLTMPLDPAHHLNPLACQADFTYTMTLRTIKIHDTGKGNKSVGDDIQAVLKKIEGWHQGRIEGYSISYRDAQGAWHQIS